MSKRYTDIERERLIDKIIDNVCNMSTNAACKLSGVPPTTFSDWITKDTDKAENYAHARGMYINTLADEIMTISDEEIPHTPDGKPDNAAVQRNRLRVESRKWTLSKLRPDKYGDRLQLAGDKDSPLKVVHEVERTVIDTNKDKQIDVHSENGPHPLETDMEVVE